MKKWMAYLLLLSILLCAFPAFADGEYLGNMEVVNCEEWVSLRESPSTASTRLTRVSLGAIVNNCRYVDEDWIYAEYDGYAGYIASPYLERSDGRLTFSAMMITITGEGAPFYAQLDSTEPIDFIPASTIVRNCCMMDNDRIYVEWGERCGFIESLHAEVYSEMIHFPPQITLSYCWDCPDSFSQEPALKAAWAQDFNLAEYEYNACLLPLADSPAEFVLYSDTIVGNVQLFSLELISMEDETGCMTFAAALEHIQPTVDWETPLHVTASFLGSIPNLAVGYQDAMGSYHFAFIDISGEDGSVLITEF